MIGAFFSALLLGLIYCTIGFDGCLSLVDHADCAMSQAYADATPDEHHYRHRSCDHIDAAAKRKAEHAARQ